MAVVREGAAEAAGSEKRLLRKRGRIKNEDLPPRSLLRPLCHLNYVRVPFNKWWPLPSHEPVPEPRSKFNFLKIATVTVSFCSAGSTAQPNHKTVWLESWDVPLSDRLAKSGVHLMSRDYLGGSF
jgi:hypothetical protein